MTQPANQSTPLFTHLLQFLGLSSLSILLVVLPLQPSLARDQILPGSNPTPDITTISDPKPLPFKNSTYTPPPPTSAESIVIIDADTGFSLYQQDPHTRRLPASTTKIMTALVALDTYDLDQILTVTREEDTIGQTMKLVAGEQITFQNLLQGLLISSGNDAALTLALGYPDGGYSGFVAAMNQKATNLGLRNTQYQNVSGLDGVNHYTSAADLAALTRHALSNPTFAQIVATKQATVNSVDGQISHRLTSTNQLLEEIEGVSGVKTGWTEAAGECLVTTVTRDGHQLITVVLGSQDRFADSAALIQWAFANHTYKTIGQTADPD